MKLAAVLASACALLAAGCARGGGDGEGDGNANAAVRVPKCPSDWRPGWQKLANRIHAPVYCPTWLPNPLVGDLHHAPSVDPDRSYQAGFHDSELISAETHVVLSGYPGKTRPPRCENIALGKITSCWLEPSGRKRVGDLEVTVYERAIGHESRHLVYAWIDGGSLYAASIHVDPRIGLWRARRDLTRMVRGLERIEPRAGATHADDEHDH